ncbi:MAG: hypothetical protein VX919_00070 [Candidatus Thermoplasmatota archaeon]|nr:hypothetical protein [Candidatus Thermoplasmatota archaeon]
MERLFLRQPMLFISAMMFLSGPTFLVVLIMFGPFMLLPDDVVLGIPAAVFEGLVLLVIEILSAIGWLAFTKPLVFIEVDKEEVRMVPALGVVVPPLVEHIPRGDIFKIEGVTKPQNDGEVHRLLIYRHGRGPTTYNAPSPASLERAVTLLESVILADEASVAEQPSAEGASPPSEGNIAPWDQI